MEIPSPTITGGILESALRKIYADENLRCNRCWRCIPSTTESAMHNFWIAMCHQECHRSQTESRPVATHCSDANQRRCHRVACRKFRHKKHLSNLHRIAVNFRCRFSRSSKILSGQRGPFGDVRSASSDSGLGPSLPFMIEPSGERKNQNFMSCISCQSKRRLFLNSTTFV